MDGTYADYLMRVGAAVTQITRGQLEFSSRAVVIQNGKMWIVDGMKAMELPNILGTVGTQGIQPNADDWERFADEVGKYL